MENTAQNCAKIKTDNDKILHERFTEYGKNAREWTRKCALLLPEIERREIWKKRGFENIYEYARILAGMSRNAVDSALWTFQKTEDKPELRKVIEEKGITSVRLIANLATQETDKFWAEKVREMSSYALAAYAKEYRKAENHACFETGIATAPQTQNISMELEPEVAEKLEKLKGSGEWNALMKKFIEMHEKQLEQEKPQPIEDAKRYVPVAIKRYALARTNSTCAFPGCSRPYEILHHTVRFALSRSHDPDKLTPLCKAHERLAHLGLIENEESAPSEWRVRTLRGNVDEKSEKYLIDQKVLKYRTALGCHKFL
ncbi:HNH endonuclease [Candidatus Peregrinibacteria bacterium]|nr:HNH endonuclease [Candidatus Peregrinibacteria bacterium]